MERWGGKHGFEGARQWQPRTSTGAATLPWAVWQQLLLSVLQRLHRGKFCLAYKEYFTLTKNHIFNYLLYFISIYSCLK